jgi:hypothetical protein
MGTLFNMALFLESMLGSNATDTTSNHDWLVVSSVLWNVGSGLVGEKSSESTGQGRTTKLVIEASRANWGLQHDVKTRGIVRRTSNIKLPWPLVAGNQEIRNPETGKTSFGRRATSNSALISNLTTASGCGTGKGGDGSGMVMRFNLDERLDNLAGELPASGGIVWSPVVTLVTGKATSEC